MQELKNIEESVIYESIRLGRLYREEGNCNLSIGEFKIALSRILPQENPFLYNRVLNELEISKGRSILESKPRGLGIALTNKCNIQCIMCNVWQNPWDIPEKTVKEITAFFPYLQRIFWQGGEVFLSPYFEELFEKVTSYPHIRQDINTNGLLINRKWAEKLVEANANIIFSIDGITKEVYEYIRRGAKFEDLLKNIKLVNEFTEFAKEDKSHTKRKCSMIINLVVMRSNYHELGGFVDFAKKYGFDHLQITPVDLSGPENIFLNRDIKALTYIYKIIPEIFEKAKTFGIRISNWLPAIENLIFPQGDEAQLREIQQCGNFETRDSTTKTNNKISCYWPWQFLFIDWGGRVRPQCFCVKALGNIHNNTIEEIWNNDIIQTYRKKLFSNDYHNWCDSRCSLGKISKEALSLD